MPVTRAPPSSADPCLRGRRGESSALRYSFFFFSSRRRHTRSTRDWSSDVCSSDLGMFSEAITDLEKAVQLKPTNKYFAIYLFLAQSRARRNSKDHVRINASQLDLKEWPGPVVSKIGRASCRERV